MQQRLPLLQRRRRTRLLALLLLSLLLLLKVKSGLLLHINNFTLVLGLLLLRADG